jgi:hypothetical protein
VDTTALKVSYPTTLQRMLSNLAGAARVLAAETLALLRLDIPSALMVVVMLALFLPTINRYSSNAALLNAFLTDEPLITMQLDGMTARPWGDPSNYLEHGDTPKEVPAYWLNIRYYNIPYYGGLYLDLALLFWLPLKLLGFPLFPTGPIILRVIALAFSIFTLLGVYNFGRRHFGIISGLLGSLFLVTEWVFLSIGTMIHPDSLLLFLSILALAICLRHARDGATASLLAIGIVAGLAQGAKMGGPLLIPITVLSIFFGSRRKAVDFAGLARMVVARGLITFAVALTVFIATTPYAILGSYFLDTWRLWASEFTGTSPIAQITFWNWFDDAASLLGSPLLAAGGLAILAHFVDRRTRGNNLPLLFAVLLGLSIFLWYAVFQRFWVQLQYLIVPFALAALIGWSLVDRLLSILPPRLRTRLAKGLVVLGVIAWAAIYCQNRIDSALRFSTDYFLWRQAPQVLVGEWLSQHKQTSTGRKVLYDLQVYFDPSDFASYPNGGPISWVNLIKVLPDYFALTVYGSGHWMGQKMRDQKSSQWDPDYWNMRLYQDLLGTNADQLSSGDPYPFIKRVATFGYPGSEEAEEADPCQSAELFSRQKLDCLAKAVRGSGFGPQQPGIVLFQLDVDGLIRSLPAEQLRLAARAFASSSADDGCPEYAVKVNPENAVQVLGDYWRSAKQGEAADGEFVGADFRRKIEPKELTIKWVASSWLPGAIEVEYSDDGETWEGGAGSFSVASPADPAKAATGDNRWEEKFALTDVGAHSFWRVVARSVPPGNFFGMEFIRFD